MSVPIIPAHPTSAPEGEQKRRASVLRHLGSSVCWLTGRRTFKASLGRTI